MAKARWAAVRSLATAVRIAVRPGGPSLGERLSSVPRLVGATFRGEYTGTSRRRLLMLAGAVLYVVSPVDFLPEAVLSVFGLVDDAFVLTWIAAAMVAETESFLAWERSAPESDRWREAQGGGRRAGGSSGSPQDSRDAYTGAWQDSAPDQGQDGQRGRRRDSRRDSHHDTVQGHVIR